MPCQVWSRWTYPLLYYSVFAADTLLYAVTLTFDLWPWTYAVYCVWHDETLYTIWMQSRYRRWSYCDFNIWPNDLQHVLHVAIGPGIIFTKFDLPQLLRAWIIVFFMLICYMLCRAMILTLTRWPWKFLLHQAPHDQSLYKIWAKLRNPWLNCW